MVNVLSSPANKRSAFLVQKLNSCDVFQVAEVLGKYCGRGCGDYIDPPINTAVKVFCLFIFGILLSVDNPENLLEAYFVIYNCFRCKVNDLK